jgi:glycosyltransferase involved in cell wall biosynthesis
MWLAEASDAELKALLLGARALLVPSIAEGFGLPALEALRAGCAVLAAACSPVHLGPRRDDAARCAA